MLVVILLYVKEKAIYLIFFSFSTSCLILMCENFIKKESRIDEESVGVLLDFERQLLVWTSSKVLETWRTPCFHKLSLHLRPRQKKPHERRTIVGLISLCGQIYFETYTRNGAITRETTAISLSRILRDGPEVSLNGSPTVSPTTAALCGSEPLWNTVP